MTTPPTNPRRATPRTTGRAAASPSRERAAAAPAARRAARAAPYRTATRAGPAAAAAARVGTGTAAAGGGTAAPAAPAAAAGGGRGGAAARATGGTGTGGRRRRRRHRDGRTAQRQRRGGTGGRRQHRRRAVRAAGRGRRTGRRLRRQPHRPTEPRRDGGVSRGTEVRSRGIGRWIVADGADSDVRQRPDGGGVRERRVRTRPGPQGRRLQHGAAVDPQRRSDHRHHQRRRPLVHGCRRRRSRSPSTTARTRTGRRRSTGAAQAPAYRPRSSSWAPRWPATPDIVRDLAADGDEIGIHTFTHPQLATLPRLAAGAGVLPDPAGHRPRHRRASRPAAASRTRRRPTRSTTRTGS